MLSITSEGGHPSPDRSCNRYFPGDVVRGHVHLKAPKALNITSISVRLLGEQQCKVIAHGRDSGWITATLLESKTELFRRDRYAGEPWLPAGTYSWPYKFTFPEMPEAWDMQRLQSRYPATTFISGGNRDALCFNRYVIQAKMDGGGVAAEETHHLTFWPMRRTSLEHGPLPGVHERSHTYVIPWCDPANGGKRRMMFKRNESVVIAARVHIPTLHIIGEPLPLQFELHMTSRQRPSEGQSMPACRITAAYVRLYAKTVVGNEEPMKVQEIDTMKAQRFNNLSTEVPVVDVTKSNEDPTHRMNLHDILRPPFTVHTEPRNGMHVGSAKHVEQYYTAGPVVPSFESPVCTRTYFVDVGLTIECNGQGHTYNVRGGDELVLLSDRLDPRFEQKQLAQLDGSRDVGRVEAPTHGIAEADGRAIAHEAPSDGHERIELPTVLPELPGHSA